MKLKYYLRGIGVGMIIATLILCISNSVDKKSTKNGESISSTKSIFTPNMEQTSSSEASSEDETESQSENETESQTAGEVQTEEQSTGETQTESQSETQTETQSVVEEPTQAPTENISEASTENKAAIIYIERGTNSSLRVAEMLEAQNAVDNAEKFNDYLEATGYDRRIQPGEKTVPLGLSYEEVANILCK